MNVEGIEPTDPPNGCGESRIWCIKLLIWKWNWNLVRIQRKYTFNRYRPQKHAFQATTTNVEEKHEYHYNCQVSRLDEKTNNNNSSDVNNYLIAFEKMCTNRPKDTFNSCDLESHWNYWSQYCQRHRCFEMQQMHLSEQFTWWILFWKENTFFKANAAGDKPIKHHIKLVQ